MKENSRKWRKPSFFLLTLGVLYTNVFYRWKYHINIDKSGIRDLHGPAVVLSPHLSNYDHMLLGMTLYPHRPTFVLSEHFMANRFLRPILHMMGCISKKMFSPDSGTILHILRAARSGCILIMFPEGRLPCIPVSDYVAPGTAELVKKLGVPVYTVTANGAAMTHPKWAEKQRHGKITVETKKILDEDALKAMSVSEIGGVLQASLAHNDETATAGVRFAVSDTTAGLCKILYRCPSCGASYSLREEKNGVRCENCGMTAVLDEYGKFKGAPVATVTEWYRAQGEAMDLSVPLTAEVTVHAMNEKRYLVKKAGAGKITLDRETFSFCGTVFGKPLEFAAETEKIGAFPISVGKWFDFYHEGRLHCFAPKDGRRTVAFVQFLDECHRRKL